MIGGRYSLDRKIGRGGMGSVWLGRDEVLGRAVAIKRIGVMPGDSSPDLLRAEREARIAASLNHPHVVGIFDLVNDDDDAWWLVMEYVAGTTLAEIIRAEGALSAERLAPILAQTVSALEAAHDAGVVHRDVKPSNILVREDGEVKLSDFGIARNNTDASLTQTGLVTGSPAYLAPEVASGRPASPASDIWSLGATAFHALAGRPPYDVGDNVLGALYQIVNQPPPRLPEPGALGPLLDGTMVVDPAARWSISELAGFLEGHAEPGALLTATVPAPTQVAGAPPSPSIDQPRSRTDVIPTAVPEPTSAPTPARTSPTAPAPIPTPVAPTRRRRDRGSRVLLAAIGLLVLALVAAIVVLASQSDPQRIDPSVNGPVDDPSATRSTRSASTPPDSTPPTTTAPTPDAADMATFVNDYLATADSDPASSFTQLTPSFQRQSGGPSQYRAFWSSVDDVHILSGPSASPGDLTVSYVYSYRRSGQGTQTDSVTLQLSFRKGRYLIDGETDGSR